MSRKKAPAWTQAEIDILKGVYPREGITGAARLLPGRTWTAIYKVAHKHGVRSPIVSMAPVAKLQGEQLERAITMREVDGWAFARIGAEFGISENAACTAITAAQCSRNGHIPAERDKSGRITPEGIERMRMMMRKGLKSIEIQKRLAVSASTVAHNRRLYAADLKERGKAPLLPAGGGAAYPGLKIAKAQRMEVEALYMEGFGAKKIAERTGVSHTTVVRIRERLVKRLKRKGQALPGCTIEGARVVMKETNRAIPLHVVAVLHHMLEAGVPVRQAAHDTGIGISSAYKFRDEYKVALEAAGRQLPIPKLPGRVKDGNHPSRKAQWMPKGQEVRLRFWAMLETMDFAQAKAAIIAEEDAKRREVTAQRNAARPTRLTFEQQLEAVRNGARLIPAFTPKKTGIDATLGGIATGML